MGWDKSRPALLMQQLSLMSNLSVIPQMGLVPIMLYTVIGACNAGKTKVCGAKAQFYSSQHGIHPSRYARRARMQKRSPSCVLVWRPGFGVHQKRHNGHNCAGIARSASAAFLVWVLLAMFTTSNTTPNLPAQFKTNRENAPPSTFLKAVITQRQAEVIKT